MCSYIKYLTEKLEAFLWEKHVWKLLLHTNFQEQSKINTFNSIHDQPRQHKVYMHSRMHAQTANMATAMVNRYLCCHFLVLAHYLSEDLNGFLLSKVTCLCQLQGFFQGLEHVWTIGIYTCITQQFKKNKVKRTSNIYHMLIRPSSQT